MAFDGGGWWKFDLPFTGCLEDSEIAGIVAYSNLGIPVFQFGRMEVVK